MRSQEVDDVRSSLLTRLRRYVGHLCMEEQLKEPSDAHAYGWDVQKPTVQWSRFIENKNKEILRLNGQPLTLLLLLNL